MGSIDEIFKNSSKAELLETLGEFLKEYDKVIIVLVQDGDNGNYSSRIMTLGLDKGYEAYGILESAKIDLAENP